MLVALIGVLGVVIGGFLNASFSYLLARRSEGQLAKTAARLVLPELLENQQRLNLAIGSERWRDIDFQTRRWQQHELAIATGFGREWAHLAAVYTALMLLNSDRKIYDDDEVIESDDLSYARLANENLEDAIRDVRKWAGLGETDVLMLPSTE